MVLHAPVHVVSVQTLTCVKGTAAVWRKQTHAMTTAAARATRVNFIFTSVTLKADIC